MREFFRGWRRKVGIVMLGAALAAMGLWVRSRVTTDYIEVPIFDRSHLLLVKHNAISWMSWNRIPNNDEWCWAVSDTPFDHSDVVNLSEIVEPWFGTAREAGLEPRCWAIKSWLLAVPPILISTILLLWPLRKRSG